MIEEFLLVRIEQLEIGLRLKVLYHESVVAQQPHVIAARELGIGYGQLVPPSNCGPLA
jgi:hypothetical protein